MKSCNCKPINLEYNSIPLPIDPFYSEYNNLRRMKAICFGDKLNE